MAWLKNLRRRMFGGTPVYDGTGGGRRALAWMPSNPGAVAALSLAQDELRAKSRDLVRRNAWAAAGIEAFVANAIGTGIKPQSMVQDQTTREAIHSLWWEWCEQADAAGLTDFYGLQALATRAMLEGGEALIRLRYRRTEDGLPVALQIQVLEAEHLPTTMNRDIPGGNVIRSGIEFDRLGRRVAYHLYRSHPNDGLLAPMSSSASGGGMDTVRVDASEVIHLFRPLRPGQIRGEPWLTRALVKLNELDQYDDAELVRKKTAAMFAGFITRMAPEDNLMGESAADGNGVALAGMEPGTLQILEPGEDIKFSAPADVGSSYAEFMRQQFRAVAAAMGITYEMLTGDLTQVNYSSIRAGLLEFRRRCEALQHGVIVHQLCRPIWRAWMDQAVLEGALDLPGYRKDRRTYQAAKWIPQGWSWVDPQKEFNAMKLAIRAGLMSRSEAISGNGYDAEDVDREIAADNARADALGLVFDSDARHDQAPATALDPNNVQPIDPVSAANDNQDTPNMTYLASRLLGTPLLIHRPKLDVILSVVGQRIGMADIPTMPSMDMAVYQRPPAVAAPDGIAVIPIHGSLVKRSLGMEAASGLTSYGEIGAMLDAALVDPQVSGILLDIDSPGGEASGSFELARRVREVAAIKPVWAVANDAAYSAAYAIAASAQRLFVTETGGVGSIGVIALHVDQSVKDAKDGYLFTAITAGAHKNDYSPHEPLSDTAKTELQGEVDRLYAIFTVHVAAMRGLDLDAVRATEAGLFFGSNAVAQGLADGIQTLDATLSQFHQFLYARNHSPSQVRGVIRAEAAFPYKELSMSELQDTPDKNLSETISTDEAAVLVAEARREVTQAAQAIAEVCLLAGCPDRAAEFIAAGKTEADVRRVLIDARAARSEADDIRSTITVDAGTQNLDRPEASPIVAAVKKLTAKE